jgi:hypothetical protein
MGKYKLKPGDRYGMLTYIGPDEKVPTGELGGRTIYATTGKWRCDCGNEVVKWNSNVINGKTKSCGCLLHDSGEAWVKGKRAMKKTKDNTVLRKPTVPVYLVKQHDSEDIIEVYDPAEELVLWLDGNGVDVMYDMISIDLVYRRKDDCRWETISVPDFAGILQKTPGVLVWTCKTPPPPFNVETKGWEVIG